MNTIAATPGIITRISTLRPATDDEVVTLQLNDQEHTELHNQPLAFINSHVQFEKPVREVLMQSTRSAETQNMQAQASGNTWLALVVHRPNSSALVACILA